MVTVTGQNGRTEVYVRNSSKIFTMILVLGCIGLVLAIPFQLFRSAYLIFVSIAALLLGAVGICDRRIKLTLLDAGVRYAQWGPVVVPWHEFAAYRWTTWRTSSYLQLLPLRSSTLLQECSPVGRLNHRLARIIGAPVFSIAVTALDISSAELAERISHYLPETF